MLRKLTSLFNLIPDVQSFPFLFSSFPQIVIKRSGFLLTEASKQAIQFLKKAMLDKSWESPLGSLLRLVDLESDKRQKVTSVEQLVPDFIMTLDWIWFRMYHIAAPVLALCPSQFQKSIHEEQTH